MLDICLLDLLKAEKTILKKKEGLTVQIASKRYEINSCCKTEEDKKRCEKEIEKFQEMHSNANEDLESIRKDIRAYFHELFE